MKTFPEEIQSSCHHMASLKKIIYNITWFYRLIAVIICGKKIEKY